MPFRFKKLISKCDELIQELPTGVKVLPALPMSWGRKLRLFWFLWRAETEMPRHLEARVPESREDAIRCLGLAPGQAEDEHCLRHAAGERADMVWKATSGPSWELLIVCIAFLILSGLADELGI